MVLSGRRLSCRVSASTSSPRHWFLRVLLDTRFSCGANLQLLAAVEANILSALAEHATRADPAANRRANRCAFAAADNGADDCSDAGARADLRYIILGRASLPLTPPSESTVPAPSLLPVSTSSTTSALNPVVRPSAMRIVSNES